MQQNSSDGISAYKVKGCGEIYCHQIDGLVGLGGSFNELLDLIDVVGSASTRSKASLGWTCNVEHVSHQPLLYTVCIYPIIYAVTKRLMALYTVGPEGSLCGFSMGMMMDMSQTIGKIQSLQVIMIIRKSQSLAIAEYLYTSAGMLSHPQARFIFSLQALSTSFSSLSSEVSNAWPSKQMVQVIDHTVCCSVLSILLPFFPFFLLLQDGWAHHTTPCVVSDQGILLLRVSLCTCLLHLTCPLTPQPVCI